MTMYLKTSPTPNTIVFSGDTRLIDSLRFTDGNLKATKLGTLSVGGAIGSTRHVHPQTGEVYRDVHALLAQFFSDKEVTAGTLAAFNEELKKQHDKYVENHCKGRTTPAKGIFSVVISTREGGKVTDRVLRADIIKDDKLAVGIFHPEYKAASLHVHGDAALRTALESRHSALADLYKEPDIERLLLDSKCDYGYVAVERAAAICRKIHKACGEHAEAITGKRSTVSEACDVWIVDAAGIRPAP